MNNGEEQTLGPDIRFRLIKRMERHKVIALSGPVLLPHEARYLAFHDVAGVVLFRRNVDSLSQVTELITSVAAQLPAGAPPPLVMADHEGDFVAELQNIIGIPPSAMALAAAADTGLAADVARETGLAMKKLGVNVVLAPVADCFLDADSPITGLRTFGCDPGRVAEFVAATVAGYRDAGVKTCAKHFPGHGSTPGDSHETMPEVDKTLDDLRRVDLLPFSAAVEAGVDMMMVSHVAYPMGAESLTPASFDKRIMNTLLREEMGFNGVVVTDALEMAGARPGRFGAGGFERSLVCGADVLLYARPVPETVEADGDADPLPSIDLMNTVIRTLEKVVDAGKIDEKIAEAAEENKTLRSLLDTLEGSYARIEKLRRSLGRSSRPDPDRNSKVIRFDAYPSVPGVYREVAERSVAAWGEVPAGGALRDARRCVVVPVQHVGADSLKKQDLDVFCEKLCRRFSGWRCFETATGFTEGDDGEVYPDVVEGPGVIDATRFTGNEMTGFHIEADEALVVVFSCRGTPPPEFVSRLGAFAARFEPAVALVLGWPVLDWIPESSATLLCFGASPQVASAAAQILAGEAEPGGEVRGLWPA